MPTSAYEFKSTKESIQLTVGDSTYAVELYSGFLCKASAVEELSGQTVTLTVSTDPLITTEAEYDGGFIYAQAAGFNRFVYEASGTTSECYGRFCPDGLFSNPLAAPTPTPTPAPTNSYIPPPSHPTTQFSPAPSCLGDSNLWLVSTSCHVLDGREIAKPTWLECAITELGEPDVYNKDCYRRGSATAGDDGTTSFYVGCPAGYTIASKFTYRPFDERRAPASREPISYDVVASVVMCCPDGDYSFQYSDVLTTTTTWDYRQQLVDMYPMPLCVATSVQSLSGKDVELTLTADDRAWDKKKRQEETAGLVVTTRPWNYEGGLLFAQAAQASMTVFHGTYSCLEGCNDYFTSSYNNTDPNYTQTSTETPERDATHSSGASGTVGPDGEATQLPETSSAMGSALLRRSRETVLLIVALFMVL